MMFNGDEAKRAATPAFEIHRRRKTSAGMVPLLLAEPWSMCAEAEKAGIMHAHRRRRRRREGGVDGWVV